MISDSRSCSSSSNVIKNSSSAISIVVSRSVIYSIISVSSISCRSNFIIIVIINVVIIDVSLRNMNVWIIVIISNYISSNRSSNCDIVMCKWTVMHIYNKSISSIIVNRKILACFSNRKNNTNSIISSSFSNSTILFSSSDVKAITSLVALMSLSVLVRTWSIL